MLKFFFSFALITISGAAGLPAMAAAQNADGIAARDPAALYQQLCLNCHGIEMRGAQAQSLVDEQWRFGGADADLAASIRDGRLEAGMPAFGAALTDAEVAALVAHIRDGAAQARSSASAARTQPALPPATPTRSRGRLVRSELHAFHVETITSDVRTPWSIAFLPDGRMLVSEKSGALRVVENGRLLPDPVRDTPRVASGGQGGLLDVAPHPDFDDNGWIYLSYSDPGPGASALTAIVRGRIRDGAWVDEETVFRAPRELYPTGGVHFGCRLVFEGDFLFFTIGERGRKEDAQDLSRPNGKVHRIHHDRRIPDDNPFVHRRGAFPSIWTYGNRNPQGLARDPVSGGLYETEHGPRGGDELNLIEKGRNYGWPVITYGINYNGTPITDRTAAPGMEQPVLQWTPSIAVCAIDFYRGDQFPHWKNQLFVTALAFEELRRLELRDGQVVQQEIVLRQLGRVRDVVSGPDGYIYLALNRPDSVVRLVPAEQSSRPGGTE